MKPVNCDEIAVRECEACRGDRKDLRRGLAGFLRCFSPLIVNVSWVFDENCINFLALLRRFQRLVLVVLSRLRTAIK